MTRSNIIEAYKLELEEKRIVNTQKQELELKNTIHELLPDIDTLSTRVIEKNGTVDFIEYIESLADDVGVSVAIGAVAVAPDEVAGEGFEQLKMAVTSEGSWRAVYSFLEALQSLPYKSTIQTVSLNHEEFASEGRASSTDTVWKSNITISVLKRTK